MVPDAIQIFFILSSISQPKPRFPICKSAAAPFRLRNLHILGPLGFAEQGHVSANH